MHWYFGFLYRALFVLRLLVLTGHERYLNTRRNPEEVFLSLLATLTFLLGGGTRSTYRENTQNKGGNVNKNSAMKAYLSKGECSCNCSLLIVVQGDPIRCNRYYSVVLVQLLLTDCIKR